MDASSISSFEVNLERKELRKHDLGGYGDDIADSLPVDPFGMDMQSTVTAIKGWIQDFDEEFGINFGEFGIDENEQTVADDGLYMGVDLFFNGSVRLQQQKGNLNVGRISILDHNFYELNADDFDCKRNLSNLVAYDEGKELGSEGGEPHDAFYFALGYLGVRELLAVERVGKSLRDAVRGDSLLWRSIHVNHPLSEKVSDVALAKLTSRAQGTLECLSIVGGVRITDDGLKHVLQRNPNLTTLCVPGCVRLTVDGILSNLKVLKSAGTLRIKQLRIGGVCDVTQEQFEELKSLLRADSPMHLKANKPQYHRVQELYLPCNDDDRIIDVDICPKCQKVKLVYDCPAETCQGKGQNTSLCRACTLCIARCIHCGSCIRDCDYEETFCLDFLCLRCFKQLLSCQDKPLVDGASSSGLFNHEMMRYQFYLYHEEE